MTTWQNIEESLMQAAAQMTWMEAVAVFFSLLYIFLAARESIWCWASAAVSVLFYIYIFLRAQLYAETGLQVFYLVMAAYGWLNWKSRKDDDKKPIIVWPVKAHALIVAGGVVAFLLVGYLLRHYSDAALPYLDAFTSTFAIATTFMVAKKVLENWIYWVIIDGASIFLYVYRDLYLTAGLFIAYTIIAVFGYIKWLRIYRQTI